MATSNYANISVSSKGSANKPEDQKQKDWVLVNPRLLIGLVGAAACFAWLFAMLATSVFFPGAEHNEYIIFFGHINFVIGVIIALILCKVFSNLLSKHRIIEVMASVVLCIGGCTGLGLFSTNTDLATMFASVLGLGFGFLYPLYGEFISKYFYSSMRNYVNGIFLGTVLLCCAFLFTGGTFAGFALCVVLIAVSLLACIFGIITSRKRNYEIVDKTTSDERIRVAWRSYLSTATSGMTVGFAVGYMVSIPMVVELPSWLYVVALLILFFVCLVLLTDSLKWHKINEAGTMRWFLPCSAVILFPIIFAPITVKFLLAVLLLGFSIVPTATSISAICKHISICGLSAIRAFSYGRLMCFFGILLGMALAFMDLVTLGQILFGELVTTVVVVILMGIIIFSTSFVMTEDNYPIDARFLEGEAEALFNADIAEDPSPHAVIKPIMERSSGFGIDSMQDSGEGWRKGGMFYAKCAAVAEKYDLSNRQREVLVLLAKGRNADYITEKLVVSPHTSKAHIYNIYQKTGVHSRQELMNLVEDTEIKS